jgi:hypothetical protein
MSDIDHKALAEAGTAYHDTHPDWTPVTDSEVFALAQVHATLYAAEQTAALVEQQKTTNLIALVGVRWEGDSGTLIRLTLEGARDRLADALRRIDAS